jgi:hypothetical protein
MDGLEVPKTSALPPSGDPGPRRAPNRPKDKTKPAPRAPASTDPHPEDGASDGTLDLLA